MRLELAFVLPLAVAGAGAHALSLDFGNSGTPTICSTTVDGLGSTAACSSGDYLLQSYGDVAGVVDVSFSAPRLAAPTSLRWWNTDYSNLYGVAWADGGDPNSRARIEIKALQPGQGVTLTDFDLGAWPNTSRSTTVNVFAIGGGTPLYTFSGTVGTGGGVAPTHFSVSASAAGGLWIEWQDSAYNVGIDNIQYTVNAVPEPGTLATLLAGIGVVGLLVRRRT
jgi:hypothetical protein